MNCEFRIYTRQLIVFLLILIPGLTYANEYIISSVPFFPAQDFQCGPSSLASVLNFLGLNITPEEIAKEIYSEGAKGTADFDMILYPMKKGLKSSHYKGSLNDLKEKIKENKPLIVMVDEGIWFYKKYHFMVVIGFDNTGIIVYSGKNKDEKIDYETFMKKWEKTGFWTLIVEKN